MDKLEKAWTIAYHFWILFLDIYLTMYKIVTKKMREIVLDYPNSFFNTTPLDSRKSYTEYHELVIIVQTTIKWLALENTLRWQEIIISLEIY